MAVENSIDLSIVIPVYKGAATIGRVVAEIVTTLDSLNFEIVLINDGSPDDSEAVCEAIAAADSRIQFISLRRNFGEHNAVMCGLNAAKGAATVVVDDDLQHPAAEIKNLYEELLKGYDVVFGRYREKQHSWFRNLGSAFNNLVANYTIKKPSHIYLSSFKIMRREVVSEVIKYRGPYPYVDGLLFLVTRNVTEIEVEHRSRESGRSNYTLKKLVELWLNMAINFSVAPLRVFTCVGVIGFLFSIPLVIFTVIEHLVSSNVPLGYSSLFIAVLIFSSIQLMSIGIVGEYLGKLYLNQNNTPQWVIKKSSVPFMPTSSIDKY